jgi:hypothetical protein
MEFSFDIHERYNSKMHGQTHDQRQMYGHNDAHMEILVDAHDL